MGRYAALDFSSKKTEESIVFWDMKRCPVPDGCCANRVAPCMTQGLEMLGISGCVNVVAIGDLTKISTDDLRTIYYSGVSLVNVDPDCDLWGIETEIFCWVMERLRCSARGNLMVISGESSLDEMSSLEEEEEKKISLDNFLRSLNERGFNIIRNLPYDCQAATSPSDLWRSVLAGLFADSVAYPEGVLVQKPQTCFCQVCSVEWSPFEESPFEKFISHLVKHHGQLSPEPKEQPEEGERKKRRRDSD